MEVFLLFFIFIFEYSMHTLNILSLNVKCLNSAVKRTRVLEYLHRKYISCALIQETHLKQSDVARFQDKLVSIYGPNETDSAFLTQISKTLLEEIDCPLVVGGDFNAVINPALDKSQSDTTANPSSKLLNKFITEVNLIDLWRIQNTKAKDFTFFLIDTRLSLGQTTYFSAHL